MASEVLPSSYAFPYIRAGNCRFSAIVEVNYRMIGWMQFGDRLTHEIDSMDDSGLAHHFDVIEMIDTIFDAGYWSIFQARFGSRTVVENTPMYFYKVDSRPYVGYMLALIGDHPWRSHNHRDVADFLKLGDSAMWNEDGEDA